MRKIKVYLKGSPSVELFDESEVEMDDYCNELSQVFHMNNISIIKTSKSTFLSRPSQITGINVSEVTEKEPATPEKQDEINEDIITDVD